MPQDFSTLSAFAKKSFAAGALCLLVGCIQPPTANTASVLTTEELKLITTVSVGKQFAKQGRMDLAEAEFRKALLARPNADNVENDLAFTLQAQGRFSESEKLYKQALAISPDNVVARQNLARLLYQDGRYEESIRELLITIDTYYRIEPDKLTKQFGTPIDTSDLVSIYRKLAITYYAAGVLDEAKCYSTLAYAVGANMYEAAQHARMLLSMDLVPQAAEMLSSVVIANSGNVPSDVMFDYSMSLYVNGNVPLAGLALRRALAAGNLTQKTRRSARLLGMLIAIKESKRSDLVTYQDGLFEDEPSFCEDFAPPQPEEELSPEESAAATKSGFADKAAPKRPLDADQYWPIRFTESVEPLVVQLCNGKDEPLI